MSDYPIRRLLLEIVTSLRTDYVNRNRFKEADLDDLIRVSQEIEALRVLIARIDEEMTDDLQLKISSRFVKLLNDDAFFHSAKGRMFRLRPLNPNRDRPHPLIDQNITVVDAVNFALDAVNGAKIQQKLDFENRTENQQRLSKIIPRQKIAPAQFSITDDFLDIAHVPAQPLEQDAGIASSARLALIHQGKQVLDGLRKSNCDLRFIDHVLELQSKLESVEDIVQLGIFNLACEEQRKRFEAELPDVVAAQLQSHLSSVSLYLAQFPDWQRFTDNAAEVELDADDVRKAQKVVDQVASYFETMPERVAPEVPKTLLLIKDAIGDPAHSSKRAAFALFRTLENLFSKIFGYAADFTDCIIKESSNKIAKWGSSAIATLFVKAILEGAGVLAPIYARLPDSGWIKSAIEIIKTLSI